MPETRVQVWAPTCTGEFAIRLPAQGQIRWLPQGGPQRLLDGRRQAAARAMPGLRRPLLLPRLRLLGTNFLAVPPTDAQLLRQLLQAPSPRLVGLQQLGAQIVRIGSRHNPVRRDRHPHPIPKSIFWDIATKELL